MKRVLAFPSFTQKTLAQPPSVEHWMSSTRMALPGPKAGHAQSSCKFLSCMLVMVFAGAAFVGIFLLYGDPSAVAEAAAQLPAAVSLAASRIQLPPRPDWLSAPPVPAPSLAGAQQLLPGSWRAGSVDALRQDPIGLAAAIVCAALLVGCLLAMVRRCCHRPSLGEKIELLEAREVNAFRELRDVRLQLSELRTLVASRAVDAEAKAEAKARAREARARSRAAAARKWCRCFFRKSVTPEPEQPKPRAAKPEETIDVMASGPGSTLRPPRDEAVAVHEHLAQGKMLIFKLVRSSARQRDVYEYNVLDPSQLQPPPVSTGDARGGGRLSGGPASKSLQQQYDGWRGAFSLMTSADDWDGALDHLQDAQRARFIDALTLLDIDHAGGAVVALLRLHNLPSEFAQPLRFGDLFVSWSPQRDGGELSVADRATCNMQSVMQLLRWCSRHGATAQHTLVKDAADTAQHEHADLHFDTMFRKLFQVSRVVRQGRQTKAISPSVMMIPSTAACTAATAFSSGRPPTAAQMRKVKPSPML